MQNEFKEELKNDNEEMSDEEFLENIEFLEGEILKNYDTVKKASLIAFQQTQKNISDIIEKYNDKVNNKDYNIQAIKRFEAERQGEIENVKSKWIKYLDKIESDVIATIECKKTNTNKADYQQRLTNILLLANMTGAKLHKSDIDFLEDHNDFNTLGALRKINPNDYDLVKAHLKTDIDTNKNIVSKRLGMVRNYIKSFDTVYKDSFDAIVESLIK